MSSALAEFIQQWTLVSDPLAFIQRSAAGDEETCRILAADQHFRWRQNSPRPIAFYLQHWPAAFESSPLLIDLLVDEFGYREEAGDAMPARSFADELAGVSDSVRQQVLEILCEESDLAKGRQNGVSQHDATDSNSTEHRLVYRIVGTDRIYVPDPHQDIFSIGRRRRDKIGGDQGCDVVFRSTNSPQASLRISRQHLELSRTDSQTFVINHGKLGTQCNGKSLDLHVPTEIQEGDRLTIAGILSLQVQQRPPLDLNRFVDAERATVIAHDGSTFTVEVSTGRLVTANVQDIVG